MCGIFGFAGLLPDPDRLWAVARAAGQRGPHGCGWTTRTVPHGPVEQGGRHLGPIDGPPQSREAEIRALLAGAVLGHTRLATMGDHHDIRQLQPIHTGDGHALTHNGVIDNPDDLTPGQPVDSIALALAYDSARRRQDPAGALDTLTGKIVARSWAVAVLDADGRIYCHRSYHPLYRWEQPEGVYLCSVAPDPAATLIPEGRTVNLTEQGGRAW